MELIGTSGSAVAAVWHCGVTFIPRLRQKERQFHLRRAVPGQMISIQSRCCAVLLFPYHFSSPGCRGAPALPPACGNREKGKHFYQDVISPNLLGMKMEPSFLGVLLSRWKAFRNTFPSRKNKQTTNQTTKQTTKQKTPSAGNYIN